MGGLECSEHSLSELEDTLRIDSEFFNNRLLELENVLDNRKTKPVNQILSKLSDGNHMSIASEYDENGVPYYRGGDTSEFIIERSTPLRITHAAFGSKGMKRSHLKKGDVLLSIVATIGNVSLVTTNQEATCNCKLAILRPKELSGEYLSVYLKTKYAQAIIKRWTRGAIQKNFILDDMPNLSVFMPSYEFELSIKNLVHRILQCQEDVEKLYSKAEKLLIDELGMRDIAFDSSNVSIKTLKESFLQTGRLDSEYYQPRYDTYFKKLSEFETTSIPMEYNIFKNTGTDYAEGVHDVGVIKTKQLSNSGIDIEGIESFFSTKMCIENKSVFLEEGDVVFASMGVGSLGKVSMFVEYGENRFVTDSTLHIYRAKPTCKVCPEMLCVYLQSKIGQELIYRYVVGSTGIINIYDSDMAKIPIPVLDEDIQEELATKVQRSFALRRKAKELLDAAKRAVEIAIEDGEEKAFEFLENLI